MGIFKDLGFGQRNGQLVAPNASKLGGLSLAEIQTQMIERLGTDVSIASDVDGVMTIPYSAFTSSVDTSTILDIFDDGSCKALYNFEGNANDVGNVYNGTPYSVTYAAGKFGTQAAVFNGTDYIDTHYKNPNGSFTISTWLYPKATATNDYIISKLWGNNDQCRIAIGTYGITAGIYSSSLSSSFANAAPFTINTWYHVVAIFTPTSTSLYINGTLIGTKNFTGTFTYDTTYSLYIGKLNNLGSPDNNYKYNNGLVDQTRFFNRVLTANEVTRLYTESRPASFVQQQSGQGDWYRYQLTANNMNANGKVYVNGNVQTVESSITGISNVKKVTLTTTKHSTYGGFSARFYDLNNNMISISNPTNKTLTSVTYNEATAVCDIGCWSVNESIWGSFDIAQNLYNPAGYSYALWGGTTSTTTLTFNNVQNIGKTSVNVCPEYNNRDSKVEVKYYDSNNNLLETHTFDGGNGIVNLVQDFISNQTVTKYVEQSTSGTRELDVTVTDTCDSVTLNLYTGTKL